jgi:hypothetical protein
MFKIFDYCSIVIASNIASMAILVFENNDRRDAAKLQTTE